jgi:abequosyltransferase
MAAGEYSILMGDDDFLADNAIEKIFEVINGKTEFGILLFNRTLVSVDLNFLRDTSWLRSDIDTQVFDFGNPLAEKYYYSLCRSLGGLFSFISSVVYKTEAIKLISFDEAFIGSSYSFLSYLIPYLRTGRKLLFLNEYLIKCRIGLPSFGTGFKRILLDLRGYSFIKETVFKDDSAGVDFINVLKYEHPLKTILVAYCTMDNTEWLGTFRPLFLSVGWLEDDIVFIEQIGKAPNWFQSKFKQKIKKLLRKK